VLKCADVLEMEHNHNGQLTENHVGCHHRQHMQLM